jgi:GT2 family glycosyltransferase
MLFERQVNSNEPRNFRAQHPSGALRRPRLRRLVAAGVQGKTISIVIVCHNEKNYLRRTVQSLTNGLPPRAEIVIVDDQSTDGSCDFLLGEDSPYRNVIVVRSPSRLGVSGARNFGAAHSRGEILVFSDAHVEVPRGWTKQVVEALAEPAVGAVVPAVTGLDDPDSAQGYGMRFSNETLDVEWLGKTGEKPYPVPLMCGCFMAVRREVFDELNGFDRGMALWGSEDLELSLHLWLRGYECLVLPQVTIAHRFTEAFQYPVNWEPLYNRLRVAVVHLGAERCFRVLSHSQSDAHIGFAWDHLVSSDVWARRNAIRLARRHDDDWYFQRFESSS